MHSHQLDCAWLHHAHIKTLDGPLHSNRSLIVSINLPLYAHHANVNMQTQAQLLLASQQPVISHHPMNHAPIPTMLCRSLSLPIHEGLQYHLQVAYHFNLVYTTSLLH